MIHLFFALLLQPSDKQKEILEVEAKGLYKKIDWQPSMDAALKKAQADGEPILVFMIVGHLAQKNAEFC
jgi:putative heme degradation protein